MFKQQNQLFNGQSRPYTGWCLKRSPGLDLKGHDPCVALEGRSKFTTRACPYLAFAFLKGSQLKFEMIEKEKEKKRKKNIWNVHWLQLGIVECAMWTWAHMGVNYQCVSKDEVDIGN